MKSMCMYSNLEDKPVIVGHPFAPIGMGEHVRSSFRAFQAVGLTVPIRDIYALNSLDDQDLEREIAGHLVDHLSAGVNIFHINGDEVVQALAHLRNELPSSAYNVIYPAWELSIYPREWAEQLERFDEIWAPSRFIFDSIQKAVSKPVSHMPLASQVEISSFLGRRYFGIPESAYAFLFYFDFTSYIDRKNPSAILQAFKTIWAKNPGADVCLVIKLNGMDRKKEDFERFCMEMAEYGYRDRVLIIDKTLSDNEIKNLVRCCDCFVSLHRSEGFGRGMAEAMYLGKPVIATSYSGNLDFMNEENSCLVRYKLIPVEEGRYPYAIGQVWAEPDIDHAVSYMLKLLSKRDYGRRLGIIASRHIRQHFSYRATGLRYVNRLKEIKIERTTWQRNKAVMVSNLRGIQAG